MKTAENRTLLLISGLIFTSLCLIGALQMRKLKRSGYYLYIIGEIAPLVVSAGLLGSVTGGSSNSPMSVIGMTIGLAIPVVFIILYTTQLKYLKNK